MISAMTHHYIYAAILIFFGLLITSCQDKSSRNEQPQPVVPVVQEQPQEQPVSAPQNTQNQMTSLGKATEDEVQIARTRFNEFKSFVLAYKGKEASLMLSSSSLEYYNNLILAARTSIHSPKDYAVLEKHLSPSIRTNVKIIRDHLSSQYIDSVNAPELYETAFNQGWIGYKTLMTASLTNFQAFEKDGNRYLSADLHYAGTVKDDLVLQIGFAFEDNAWKIDLVPIFVGLDKNIRQFIQKKNLDVDLSIDETVESTKESLEPAHWKDSIHRQDGFSVKFPRSPLFADSDGNHVYTSQHFKYGQFIVSVLPNDPALPQSPYNEKLSRDRIISAFLKELGASGTQCRYNQINTDHLIQCDFQIPGHSSQGKSVWIFTPDHTYQLLNIARQDQFSDEAAAAFISSFAYGLK